MIRKKIVIEYEIPDDSESADLFAKVPTVEGWTFIGCYIVPFMTEIDEYNNKKEIRTRLSRMLKFKK